MKKIEQNKAQKKQAILAAAEEVFLVQGYIQASMDKIADVAKVTKQTVYRYFPSKIDLFRATLQEMGKTTHENFFTHLKKEDTQDALLNFAKAFIAFHVSDQHIATFRLLVSESAAAPELTKSFFEVGPDNTDDVLADFFEERLNLSESQATSRLWTAMLIEPRNGVLVGMKKPTKKQIERYANVATDFLLSRAH